MKGALDTSGLERLAHDWEHGPGSIGARSREFARLFPAELAKVRRAAYRHAGMYPVAVNGSVAKGLHAGYFATPLRDGTQGFYQRRTDDCLQAAIACCLQVPPHLVPDLHLEAQLAAGKDPEQVERDVRETMRPWLRRHGVSLRYHVSPPTSERRWIGVVRADDVYSDHCLLMTRRECLFDPANLMGRLSATQYDPSHVDYAITIERN